MEVAVPDELKSVESIGLVVALESLSVDGEAAAVENAELAALDGCDDFFDLLGCAFGAAFAQFGNLYAVILESEGCVAGYALALHGLVEYGGVGGCPNVLRAGEGGSGGNGEHIDIVAHAVDHLAGVESCLNRCGGACGIGVLADEDAALAHESVCGFTLGCYVCPAVCKGDVHVRFGDYASDSEQEGCVARNYLGIGIGSDIAYIGVFYLACVQKLLELHAGNNAGDIAGLEYLGEEVYEVLELACCRALA